MIDQSLRQVSNEINSQLEWYLAENGYKNLDRAFKYLGSLTRDFSAADTLFLRHYKTPFHRTLVERGWAIHIGCSTIILTPEWFERKNSPRELP